MTILLLNIVFFILFIMHIAFSPEPNVLFEDNNIMGQSNNYNNQNGKTKTMVLSEPESETLKHLLEKLMMQKEVYLILVFPSYRIC